MKTSIETTEKYMKYLLGLKKARTFNLHAQRKAAQIGNGINSYLTKNDYVVGIGNSKYKWIGPKTSLEAMLQDYFEQKKDYMRSYMTKVKRRNANKEKKSRIGSIIEFPIHSEWTEKSAIDFLKKSPNYQYEIYRIKKEQL